jgi:hypothetical protein
MNRLRYGCVNWRRRRSQDNIGTQDSVKDTHVDETTEKRRRPRTPAHSRVRVTDGQGNHYEALTRDLSQGGLFILIDTDELPDFGTRVTVQMLEDEEAPISRAVVVRVEAGQGIAVELMQD